MVVCVSRAPGAALYNAAVSNRNHDFPLLRFPRERSAIVKETAERALQAVLHRGAPEYILNDTCLHEIRRLSESSAQEEVKSLGEWKRLWRHLGSLERPALLDQLAKVVHGFTEDVAGGFSPPVYGVATQLLPPVLGLLLTPESVRDIATHMMQPTKLLALLHERLQVEGALLQLQRLARRATLVCVPTHLSNLDSPVMGYALQRANLPPTTYGAGKNLFTNPVLGFFMRNLGAYRVDRRIRHDVYKDVLKTYSQVILERGYHSMFFPGGTRSRSGRVEHHLKLGLLGTTLSATVERYRRITGAAAGPPIPPIYIVPVTINMQLVLEAETLIADYLKETGKSRFIIDDDESTQLKRMVQFVRSTVTHAGAVVIRFGAPLDVLGNPVDEEGHSLGPHGQAIDLSRYFWVRGVPQIVPQRDAEYMNDTGVAITRGYRRDTVLMPTHLLATVAWRYLDVALPGLDLYRRLRQPLDLALEEGAILADIEKLQARLRQRGHLLGPHARGSAREVLDAALSAFASYHSEPAILRTADGKLALGDRQILYYYQNRIDSLGVLP
jgi:glycerol-3-phosphate O-acyltransferase